MRAALFVPCYVDQLWPDVGLAAAEVLEAQGVELVFPEDQTCCGQPFLTDGFPAEARRLARRFVDVFAAADHVVCPSGSCAAMVRHQYAALLGGEPPVARRTWELCEFLVDVLGVSELPVAFAHKVGLHPSCHGVRELGLARPSERPGAGPDKVALLLGRLAGLELVAPERADECCGFGGAFSVTHPTLSGRMGRARLRALADAGADYVTSADVSCLLHLDGLRRREGFGPRAIHLAEILANGASGPESRA